MPRNPNLRVSDAERDEVAGHLRESLAEGRLTLDEFDERLGQVYAAKTYAELDRITVDLPPPPPPAPVPVSDGAMVRRRMAWQQRWAQFVAVNTACWGLWGVQMANSSGHEGLWPLWITVPWGYVLLSSGARRKRRQAMGSPPFRGPFGGPPFAGPQNGGSGH